jgi:predicted MFS family arabinose efflux permease
VPVASQTWFSRAAPHAPEAASVLFTASYQATFASGALVGGAVLDRSSPSVVMLLGGCTAALMVVAVWSPWLDGPAASGASRVSGPSRRLRPGR